MVPGVRSVDCGKPGYESARDCVIRYRIQCVDKKFLETTTPYTFIADTKLSIVFGTGRSMNYAA